MALEYGKMLLNIGFRAVSGCIPGGVLVQLTVEELGPAFCEAAWDKLKGWRSGEQRAALEQMGQVSVEEARALAEAALPQEGLDPAVRAAAVEYLAAIPMSARRTLLADASAPGGLSLPQSQVPRSKSELLRFLPLRPPRFRSGQSVAGYDYRLERLLGQGGFGEVWLATNPRRPRQVPRALKFCLDEPMRLSLERETELLDRIEASRQHPGIVRLLQTALSAELPFLVYEYVDGGDLTSWIAAESERASAAGGPARPEPGRVVAVLLQVADALSFAHELGLVHRDLKPSNVLLDLRGAVKLADFGIGAVVAEQEMERARVRSQPLSTRFSALQGSCTPMYADRAQRRGEAVDARADVYAVGVMAYQMLLGDVCLELSPYFADELRAASVPDELIALVTACIALPERRLRDGAALLQMLRPVAAQLGVVPQTPRRDQPVAEPARTAARDEKPAAARDEKSAAARDEKPAAARREAPAGGSRSRSAWDAALTRPRVGVALGVLGILMCVLSVLAYLTQEGRVDWDEAMGVFAPGVLVFLVGGVLARCGWGKIAAVAGTIVVAAAIVSPDGPLGELFESHDEPYFNPPPPQETTQLGSYQPAAYGGNEGLPAEYDEPEPPPYAEKGAPSKDGGSAPSIAGTWQGIPGLVYNIQQQGNQVWVQEVSTMYGPTGGGGQGTIDGYSIDLVYRTPQGAVGRGLLQLSADGRQISGSFVDSVTGMSSPTSLRR